jgi:hypothetical protein
VRHRLDAEVVLDPLGQLDGGVPGAAARAIGHRYEVGVVVLKLTERQPQRSLTLLGLGREELEREDRAPVLEDLGNAHPRQARTLTRVCQGWCEAAASPGQRQQ